jgi:hypothetical protein
MEYISFIHPQPVRSLFIHPQALPIPEVVGEKKRPISEVVDE